MNKTAVTAHLELAQPCGCAQLLVGPCGQGQILCCECLNSGYRAWFHAQSMETRERHGTVELSPKAANLPSRNL